MWLTAGKGSLPDSLIPILWWINAIAKRYKILGTMGVHNDRLWGWQADEWFPFINSEFFSLTLIKCSQFDFICRCMRRNACNDLFGFWHWFGWCHTIRQWTGRCAVANCFEHTHNKTLGTGHHSAAFDSADYRECCTRLKENQWKCKISMFLLQIGKDSIKK